jgi:hypothetical protein
MALIDDMPAAQRLAKAILADIQLYNAETLAQGGDLSPQIAEGRELFHARVVPHFHPMFEAMLSESPVGGAARPGGSPFAAVPPGTTPLDTPSSGSSASVLAVVAVVIVVVLGVVVFIAK